MQVDVLEVERDLLYQIIFNLGYEGLTVEEAQSIAKDFLSMLPFTSKEDLYQKLATLADRYPLARDIFLKYGAPIEEEKTQLQIQQTQQLINQQAFQTQQDTTIGGNL